MPLIDFTCKPCTHTIEHLVRNGDLVPVCKHCGKLMEREEGIPSGTSFSLKPGSVGWSRNGYGSTKR